MWSWPHGDVSSLVQMPCCCDQSTEGYAFPRRNKNGSATIITTLFYGKPLRLAQHNYTSLARGKIARHGLLCLMAPSGVQNIIHHGCNITRIFYPDTCAIYRLEPKGLLILTLIGWLLIHDDQVTDAHIHIMVDDCQTTDEVGFPGCLIDRCTAHLLSSMDNHTRHMKKTDMKPANGRIKLQ